MADQRHDASFTDTGLRSRVFGSTAYRTPPAPRESTAELRVDGEDSRATVDRIDTVGRAADEVAAAQITALYGVHHGDGLWFTECAWCNRVRSVAGDWHALAASHRSAIRAERTHGI